MDNIFSLDGRTALITGSAAGLGKAMAIALARHGAQVIINGRDKKRLADTRAEIRGLGFACEASAFDVTDHELRSDAMAHLLESHGAIDILINNVGYRDRQPVENFEAGAMSRMADANLTAPFELARLVLPAMVKQEYGRIINITSVVAQISGRGDATYTAVKAGLESLTRALAAEYGRHGITVNNISPGFFATEPNRELVADKPLSKWLASRSALGRWGDPGEIAGAAVFLSSDAASFVTGQTLCVDGGMLGQL